MTDQIIRRRDFLVAGARAAALVLLPTASETAAPVKQSGAGATTTLTIGVIAADHLSPAGASAMRGVTLGVEECARTAALLGSTIATTIVRPTSDAVASLKARAAIAVITGLGAEESRALNAALLPIIDLGLGGAEQACGAHVYYMAPSIQIRISALLDHAALGERRRRAIIFADAAADMSGLIAAVRAAVASRPMLTAVGLAVLKDDDASAQVAWALADEHDADLVVLAAGGRARDRVLRAAPTAGRSIDLLGVHEDLSAWGTAAGVPSLVTRIVLASWHDSLEKFGAAQLNDRYRARWNSGMTSAGWAGWMAVKCLFETAIRRRGVDAASAPPLSLGGARFDGHKGAPLFFSPADHRLRHPLYITELGGRTRGATRVVEIGGDPHDGSLPGTRAGDAAAPMGPTTSCARTEG